MSSNPVRKPYQKLHPETWLQIRWTYESGGSSARLCEQYGISRSTFHSRRRKEGWRSHNGSQGDSGRATSAEARPSSGKSSDLLQGTHLDEAIDQDLVADVLEEHGQAGTGALAPPEYENDLRALASEASRGHLRLARILRFRIDQLMADDRLGAGPQGRMSRSAVDLSTAIEKLQKVERKALEMDGDRPLTQIQAVIVTPGKMDPDEWAVEAKKLVAAE